MNWLVSLALKFLDNTMQRAIGKGNRAQSIGGLACGAGLLAAMDYLETQMGCNLSELKFAAIVPVIQGAYATGTSTTVGDETHVKEGGNSF